jgi:flagellar biosynthesis protein FliQ
MRPVEGPEVLDLGRDALWTTVLMCAPAMIAGLVVGLAIAFFQALTQVQEMTLVFVPKILAIFVALVLFLPLMGAFLAGFSTQIFERIAAF